MLNLEKKYKSDIATSSFLKMIPYAALIFSLSVLSSNAKSQIVISLIFGDKLNTGNIEFGLDGGWNRSNLTGLTQSEGINNFNLGFYFDIKLKKEPWMIHTGVIVKSNMGASNLPAYTLNDAELDPVFAGGTVDRRMSYFNVPIFIKYTIKQRVYLEGGPMLGLLYKVTDSFSNSSFQGNEVMHENDVRKKFHPLDAGVAGGIGYRIVKGYGMNLGVRYYYGLVDVLIDDSGDSVSNRSLYVTIGIPIGVGKARARAEAEGKQPELNK